jgi:hypothetical protein
MGLEDAPTTMVGASKPIQFMVIARQETTMVAPRQLRLDVMGRDPTADMPEGASKRAETPPCYRPCRTCGTNVLTGRTAAGAEHALDVDIATYVVLWDSGAPYPLLQQSGGYPVHRCGQKAEAGGGR